MRTVQIHPTISYLCNKIEFYGMNERSHGALEALSYIRQFLKDRGDVKATIREIDYLIELLLSGAVRDFRQRISEY